MACLSGRIFHSGIFNRTELKKEGKKELKEEDISCQLTAGVFVEPVITNCGHTIEKIALAKHLKDNNTCPFCRTIITSAVPDIELAKKIQKLFVEYSPEKKKIFEDQKNALLADSRYFEVRDEPLSSIFTTRRYEININDFNFDEDPRLLGNIFFATQRLYSIFRNAPRRSIRYVTSTISLSRTSQRAISYVLSSSTLQNVKTCALNQFTKLYNLINPSDEYIFQKAVRCIGNDDITQAKIYLSRISNNLLKDKGYKKIAVSYLLKVDLARAPLHLIPFSLDLKLAKKIARKITNSNIKSSVYVKIALKHIDDDVLTLAKNIVIDHVRDRDKNGLFEKICSKILAKEYSLSNIQEVLSIINLMTDDNYIEKICDLLFDKCIDNNDFENAEQTIQNYPFNLQQRPKYILLSYKLINSGSYENLKRAVRITDNNIEEFFAKNANFEIIAFNFAHIKHFEDAYETIEKHTNPSTRKELFSSIRLQHLLSLY